MKLFKISVITLIAFGWAHFLCSNWIYRKWPDKYLRIKFWIGKITIGLATVVVGSALWIIFTSK